MFFVDDCHVAVVEISSAETVELKTGMSLKGAMNKIRPNHPTTCHLHCRVKESSNTNDRKTVAKLSHAPECHRLVFDKKISTVCF